MSDHNPPDLQAAMERFFALADKVKEAREADGRIPGPTTTEIMTTMRDLEATITTQATSTGGNGTNATPGNPARLCEIGPQDLTGPDTMAESAGRVSIAEDRDRLTSAFPLWMARHRATLNPREPVVNALAALANRQRAPAELKALYADLTVRVGAAPKDRRRVAEDDTITQPRRLLLLNRALLATRSLDAALMEEAFDAVPRFHPEDPERFFEQGMGHMDVVSYPEPTREAMRRYYQRTLAPKTFR